MICKCDGRCHLSCLVLKDGKYFWLRLRNDKGGILLDDPGFFGCNPWQCVTQQLLMIKSNICDQANVGLNHIGAVKSPAQSNLHNGDIHFLRCEIFKCHSRSELKKRRLKIFDGRTNLVYEIHNERFLAALSVNSHSFCKRLQMRRSVETRFITRCLKNRSQHVRRAPFPVGACDMNASKLSFRMSQE